MGGTVRVVSLVPSVTETLAAWGVTPVACTRFCERPDLRHVGGTKDPDVAAIAQLEPDLVVLDAQENRREDYEDLRSRSLPVLALDVTSVAGVEEALAALAAAVGVRVPVAPPPPAIGGERPAFVPIWRNPWIALGAPTYGADVLARLGVVSVFATDGPYPHVTLAAARARHPAVVLAPSEPYPFTARQRADLETVGPVVFCDGRDLFWWGARTAGALGRLADHLARSL